MSLGCAATLSACGGGGGGGDNSQSASSSAQQSSGSAKQPAGSDTTTCKNVIDSNGNTFCVPINLPSAPKTHITVMIRGDSTNYGSHPGMNCGSVPAQTCANPTALMQADFDILFGPGVVTVVDRAEPGSTLADDLNGNMPYGELGPLARELSQQYADIVITNSEINDYTHATPQQYQANLTQWVDTVRAAGMLPIVEESNPVCLTRPSGTVARDDSQYLDAMHSVSLLDNVTVLPVYSSYLAQTNWPTTLQADCVHPQDSGYEFKEGQYMRNLYPIVKTLLASR